MEEEFRNGFGIVPVTNIQQELRTWRYFELTWKRQWIEPGRLASFGKWGLFGPVVFAQWRVFPVGNWANTKKEAILACLPSGVFAQWATGQTRKKEAILACTSLLTNKISENLGDFFVFAQH